MAKKMAKKTGGLPDPFELMKSIDSQAELLSESEHNITDWIDTGWALLNCAISGSMFRGVPGNKILTLCGDSGTGKTFLACSIARNAQKMGKTILYLDSESAMDETFATRLGIDSSKMIIRPVSTVLECTQILTNLCATLKQQDEEYGEHNQFYVVLDSISNLASNKEKEDAMAGDNKRDLTRQQQIKSFYRAVVSDMGYLNVGMTVIAHTYQTMSMYATSAAISGGTGVVYSASVILDLFASKLADKENDDAAAKSANSADIVKTGIIITAKPRKSRFTIPRKVKIAIPFYRAPTPTAFLHEFISWKGCGICRGNILTQKEYDKLSDDDKKKVYVWEHNGETKYAVEKDTARSLVVRHLGGTVPVTDIYKPEVLTEEVMRELDEKVMRPAFELPDANSNPVEEIEELVEASEIGSATTED